MEITGPPVRYPTSHISATEDAYRASNDTTLAESIQSSIPSSPRQPPAYGAERAPPGYEEEIDPNDIKARRKRRRTLCIRLMTSIFITVLVSLIVAAVVARIHDSQSGHSSSNDTSNKQAKSNGTSFTMTQEPSSTQPVATADAERPHTVINANKVQVTETSTPTPQVIAGQSENQMRAVDCDSYASLAQATPVTYIPGGGAARNQSSVTGEVDRVAEDNKEIIGVSVYKLGTCVLTKTAFLVAGSGIVHQCAEMCPNEKMEANQVRDVAAEEWGACG